MILIRHRKMARLIQMIYHFRPLVYLFSALNMPKYQTLGLYKKKEVAPFSLLALEDLINKYCPKVINKTKFVAELQAMYRQAIRERMNGYA